MSLQFIVKTMAAYCIAEIGNTYPYIEILLLLEIYAKMIPSIALYTFLLNITFIDVYL